jgi:hypothetical protein
MTKWRINGIRTVSTDFLWFLLTLKRNCDICNQRIDQIFDEINALRLLSGSDSAGNFAKLRGKARRVWMFSANFRERGIRTPDRAFDPITV